MSYSENGGTQFTMPVAPYGGMYGGGNDGFLGSNGAWWLIILLLFCNNGWGNGFGFGGGGGMFPWMMNNTTNSDVQRGFDQSAIMGSLNGITLPSLTVLPMLRFPVAMPRRMFSRLLTRIRLLLFRV